jgi:hypothetical protein
MWPVNQIVPSGAASGSCGRAPSVGTGHSRMLTDTAPGTIAAGGSGFSGKFFVR